MSAILDMETIPLIVDDVIRPLVSATAQDLWSAMTRVERRKRVGRSQLHGLVEIARNQPELLKSFIDHQQRRAENTANQGAGGGEQPHVRFWSALNRRLDELKACLSKEFLDPAPDLSRSERQALSSELVETFVPIWALLVGIEYQYLEMSQGD